MEQAPPSTQVNCQWCNKPMDSTAVRCNNCGKLRKDIYTDKMKFYSFCIIGGLLIGFSIGMSITRRNDFYGNSSGSSTGTILLVIGILAGIVGLYFYYKVSQQLKTWWWF